ncbi:MAG: hypothetical protein Fur0044_21800 [Anaerolineae bacterium]
MADKNRQFQLNKNLQISDQIAENIANDGTYYQQDCNHDDSNQDQNQRIFNQALPLFMWHK